MKKIFFLLALLTHFLGSSQAINLYLVDANTPNSKRVYVTSTTGRLPTPSTRVKYVTTSGGTGAGDIGTPWSLAHAFANAVAGDLIHVAPGNYGSTPLTISVSGTASLPIKFMGYNSTAGDIVSFRKSTIEKTVVGGIALNPATMPTLRGTGNTNTGLTVSGNYVIIENFQVEDFSSGLLLTGNNNNYVNIVTNECNWNLEQQGDDSLFENCLHINARRNAHTILGGENNITRNSVVWSDYPTDPFDTNPLTGYHFGATSGANGNIFEGCTMYRIPDSPSNYHQGHGGLGKHNVFNNTWRNCVSYNTGIELNFSDVRDNLFENWEIYGNYTTNNGQFSSGIRLINGAHHNTFKNIYIEDTNFPFNFHDFDDGFTPTPDTDLEEGGNNNTFINIIVNKMWTLVSNNTIPASARNATLKVWDNTWINCTFYDQNGGGGFYNTDMVTQNNRFINCVFDNFNSPYPSDLTQDGTAPITYPSSNISSSNFAIGGTTTHAPNFAGPLTSFNGFQLQSNSLLKNIGQTEVLANTDFFGGARPEGAAYDIGAFEEGATIAPPTSDLIQKRANSIMTDF